MSASNPITFLDLVQRLHLELELAGAVPQYVEGQTGEAATLVNSVTQAWLEIQNMHDDWDFNRVSPGVSFATIAGQQIYTPTEAGITAGDVASWAKNTFRVYLTSAGFPSEIEMRHYEYDDWRDVYQKGTQRTAQQQPIAFTVLPNRSLGLQCPLTGYTITGDYFSVPYVMTVGTDVPTLPARYKMVIVYKAMMTYGLSQSAPELYNLGKTLYTPLYQRLVNTRLPRIRSAGAMA